MEIPLSGDAMRAKKIDTLSMIFGLCCTNRVRVGLSLSQMDVCHGLCGRYAKGGLAVEDSDTDLDLRDLPVEVLGHEALTHQFHTMHLDFDAGSAVVSSP